jgi:glycosyltransferase involved in cell wall biosynthesis
VRAIHHPHNLGYGAALRTGFRHASKELVFYTDCDEPVDLSELKRALAYMQPGVDLVVGYRVRRHDTLRRWIYSRIYNLLVRFLFGVPVRDVNFSFKLDSGSTFIDGELLAEACRAGCTIKEIGVEYRPRQCGKSSFDSWHAALHALGEMMAYLRRTRSARRDVRGTLSR